MCVCFFVLLFIVCIMKGQSISSAGDMMITSGHTRYCVGRSNICIDSQSDERDISMKVECTQCGIYRVGRHGITSLKG